MIYYLQYLRSEVWTGPWVTSKIFVRTLPYLHLRVFQVTCNNQLLELTGKKVRETLSDIILVFIY